MLAAVCSACGCTPAEVARIEVPGYPPCREGGAGDLSTTHQPVLTVNLDLRQTRQTMFGFGASDCWSGQFVGQWPLEKRESIADLLFETGLDAAEDPRGIGLSVWRFNIGAGSSRQGYISKPWRRADTFYNDDFSGYDWERLPGQRWLLQAAHDRGVDRLIAFVNSPPVNMTKNGKAFCDPDAGSTNLADGMEDAFSGYLADIVEHFREVEGLEFDVLSPFNEAQWDWENGTQEGCRYSVADMKKVVDALAGRPGLGNTEIEIPESGAISDLWTGENYLQAFFDRESPTRVRDLVADRIAAHSYKTDLLSTALVESRRELRMALDRYPDLQYVMTEFCPLGPHGGGRDLGMDTALHVVRVVHFDLVVAEASSWQWWLGVSPYDYKDGLIYIDHQEADGEILESKLLWTMGNFSRFVRPGMVRLEARRSDDAGHEETAEGLMVSSFLDRERGVIATVLINRSDSGIPLDLVAEGSDVDRWIPYVTSADHDLRAHQSVPAGETVLVPPRSVVTLIGQTQVATNAKMLDDLLSPAKGV